MNRTIARLFALFAIAACASAACGGKVVFDGTAGGVSATTSSTSSAGVGSGGTAGAGGCDAASHVIDLTDFDVSCKVASDCIPVFIGDLCSNCTCPGSAINAADQMKYQAEVQAKAAGTPPGGCFCPASKAVCAQGQCAAQLP